MITTSDGLGDRIRAARALVDLTQTQLADKTGISRSQLANIEAGNGDPSLTSLIAIANAAGVTVGALLGEQPMPELPAVTLDTVCVVTCARCGPIGRTESTTKAQDEARQHRQWHLAGGNQS